MKRSVAFVLLTSLLAPLSPSEATDPDPNEKTLAFPTAEGAGAYTVGGRLGTVYHVVNLHASGPGSLADAVSRPNRFVVFDVSGVIDLTNAKGTRGGHVALEQPHVTIAGQTAPGDGICIRGGSLSIHTSDVIVRHLRVRRGFVADQDTGDSVEVKPLKSEVAKTGEGSTPEKFDKIKEKKIARGKGDKLMEPLPQDHIILDHVSASWSTDENLTMTHPNFTTVQYCIASEGLDYTNAKQTPPNHSEGSLWGVALADGRSTMHHTLYAHNRLRNPRTTGGGMPPPILDFYNNVVYDWSEYASHTGSEAVRLNWRDNFYKPGPSTPANVRGVMFTLRNDPASRMYAAGNVIDGMPAETEDNWKAIRLEKKLTPEQLGAIHIDQPFDVSTATRQSAREAYEAVLADAGATLPARDPVDLRIMNEVRTGTGRVIGKETDLPESDRWPKYHTLPAPSDADNDGIPDFWEAQFNLNPRDAAHAMRLSAGGYANIEHYVNNTDPTGATTPIVFLSAIVSRASSARNQPGQFRIARTGDDAAPLEVRYQIEGSATAGKDYQALSGTVTIPAHQRSATVTVTPKAGAENDATIVVRLVTGAPQYHVGCPSASLVVVVP